MEKVEVTQQQAQASNTGAYDTMVDLHFANYAAGKANTNGLECDNRAAGHLLVAGGIAVCAVDNL